MPAQGNIAETFQASKILMWLVVMFQLEPGILLLWGIKLKIFENMHGVAEDYLGTPGKAGSIMGLT